MINDATELYAALSSAQGGDRIELAPGNYGDVGIGHDFTSDVTIVSADPANPAVFTGMDIWRASHIILDAIRFDFSTPESTYNLSATPFDVDYSSFITIINSVFDGAAVVRGQYGSGKGLMVRNSDHIVIENNEFLYWWKAMGLHSNTDVVVRNNDFHSQSNDAINLTGAEGLLIESNWFHGFLMPDDWGHNDMIQMWGNVGDPVSKDIIIRGNFFDAGTDRSVQTIFLRNGIVDQGRGSFEQYAYRNILIEDNVIYNAHSHGITVGETDGLVIRNNTILHDAFITAGPDWNPVIRLKTASQNVTVENNIVVGDSYGSNFGAQDTDPNGANYYGDLFVNALVPDATLADLRALPGGVIETEGFGAEMTRSDIDITLGVGPAPGSELPEWTWVSSPDPAPDPVPEPDPVPDPEPIPDPEPDPELAPGQVFLEGTHVFTGVIFNPVVFAHDPAYELAAGTLELVFTANTLATRQGLFSKDSRGYDAGGHLTVLLEGSDILIRMQSTTADHVIRLTNAVQTGTEYHLALTFGPDGMKAWLNGALAGQNAYTGGFQGNTEPIVIGANQWASGDEVADKLRDGFDGTIVRTSLYDQAMSADEIQLLFEPDPIPEPANDAPTATDCELERDALLIERNELLSAIVLLQADADEFVDELTAQNAFVTSLSVQVSSLEAKITAAQDALA